MGYFNTTIHFYLPDLISSTCFAPGNYMEIIWDLFIYLVNFYWIQESLSYNKDKNGSQSITNQKS